MSIVHNCDNGFISSEILLGSAVYCSIVSLFAVALEAFPTADSNASGYPVPL